MEKLSGLIKTADWKSEKHVPVVECNDSIGKGESFKVKVTIGKGVSHPNTTGHHIRWIKLYYREEGGKFAVEIANVEFNAHGESAKGADQGGIYCESEAVVSISLEKSGMLYAVSYCNIHGLWESMREIIVK